MHSSSPRVQCIHGHMYQNGAKRGWALLLHITFCPVLTWGVDQGRVFTCSVFRGGCSEPQCSQTQPCLPAVTPRVLPGSQLTLLADVGLGFVLVCAVTQTVHRKAPRV